MKHIANAQRASHDTGVHERATESQRGSARNDDKILEAGQDTNDVVDDAVGEIAILFAGEILTERQDGDGGTLVYLAADERTGRVLVAREVQAERADGLLDVLQVKVAQIDPAYVQAAVHLLGNDGRHHDPARLGITLQTGRDVHAFTENIVRLDDRVGQIDSHSEDESLGDRRGLVPGRQRLLQGNRTAQRIGDVVERGKKPIAGVLDDRAAPFGDARFQQFTSQVHQTGVGPLLVRLHVPRIARHVRHEDGAQFALPTRSLRRQLHRVEFSPRSMSDREAYHSRFCTQSACIVVVES